MKINPSLSAAANLFDLLVAKNAQAPSSVSQVTFTNLQADTNPDDETDNTSIVLNAVSGQGFTGTQKVFYGRLALSDQVTADAIAGVSIPGGSTLAQILALVASTYKLIPGEFSFVTTPVAPGTQSTTANEIQCSGSLVYLDGTASINLEWQTSTVLLMHFDGANNSTTMTDTAGNVASAIDGAHISTTQSKFGGSSAFIGTAGDSAVQVNNSAVLEITGAFTIEMFHYIVNSSGNLMLLGKGPNAEIEVFNGAYFIQNDAKTAVFQGATVAVNTWAHIALVKTATNAWAFYVNGLQVASGSNFGTFGDNTSALLVGNSVKGFPLANSYIDELRISNVARYSANFTPPAAPFVLD